MKIINIHNHVATGTSLESIDLPSDSEMAVASLRNRDSSSMIELWFDGTQKMFSPSLEKVRNRASTNILKFGPSGPSDKVKAFETLGESEGFRTSAYSANFTRSRPGDWTVAAVFTMDDVPSGNRSLIGRRPGDEASVNPPNINIDRYSTTGMVRSFSGTGITDRYNAYPLKDDVNFVDQPVLVILSQSEKNGGTVRVNGIEKLRDTSAIAKRPSTGLELNLFSGDIASGAWQGVVGSLILLNKDISDDDRALSVLEGHMMEKFGIAP